MLVYKKGQYIDFSQRSKKKNVTRNKVIAVSKLFKSIIKNIIPEADSFNFKQIGVVFMMLMLSTVMYNFNFPNDKTEMSTVVSAVNLEESSYVFNNSNYLSAGSYKMMPENDKVLVKTYTVEPGDNISSIAKASNLKSSTVLGANQLGNGEIIKPGQKIKLPARDGVIYTVKKGDTITSLAKKYNLSSKIIKRVNYLKRDNLKIGEELLLAGVDYVVPKVSRNNRTYYTSRDAYVPVVKKTYANNGNGILMMPTKGVLTQGYHRYHHAIDIGAPLGRPIYAAEAGTVSLVSIGGYGHGYGNYIRINHGGGLVTLYAHMSKVFVVNGQKVARGEAIGQIGSTGHSTGPHLHFEVIKGKAKVNPWNYL